MLDDFLTFRSEKRRILNLVKSTVYAKVLLNCKDIRTSSLPLVEMSVIYSQLLDDVNESNDGIKQSPRVSAC